MKENLSKEEREKIIKILEDLGAKAPCPRCHNSHFTLVNGLFSHPVQPLEKGFHLGGPQEIGTYVVNTKSID